MVTEIRVVQFGLWSYSWLNKSDSHSILLNTHMITDRIGWHEVLLPISPLSPVAFTYFPDKKYSRTPLFQTRLFRSPCYFEGGLNSLVFTLMFSVIYYQLFRTWLFRIPRYFELIVLNSLHLKSTPLFWTCQKQSMYIGA